MMVEEIPQTQRLLPYILRHKASPVTWRTTVREHSYTKLTKGTLKQYAVLVQNLSLQYPFLIDLQVPCGPEQCNRKMIASKKCFKSWPEVSRCLQDWVDSVSFSAQSSNHPTAYFHISPTFTLESSTKRLTVNNKLQWSTYSTKDRSIFILPTEN